MNILEFETTDTLCESVNSIIYRAKPLDGTANVVLKMLKGDHPSPQRLARFRREFATTSQCQSPNILKVIRQEPFSNTLVSIVEDFGADSLSNWIRLNQLSLRERLSVAIAICEGLCDIHSLGVIHKDITPANILWNRATNTVKITGFGMSLPIERTLTVPYSSGVLEGTLSSMSPEQTGRMNRPVDYRSDFYSLGVTLYELFTGEMPFASEDPLEIIHCHVAKRPVPPAKRPSETPEAISNIILKLMEKNAEDRYQSNESITEDLVECLRQLDAQGTINHFPQASRDVSCRFQISPKLYGREHEVALLGKAFERVLAGEIAFTLVNGYSGVGKSSLVQELYRPLAVAGGRYITDTVAQQTKMMEELSLVSLQRKAAEEETCRLNAELEQRVQDRTAELTRSNQELEQFAYVASHDLQEPLRKVSSFAQLLAAQYKGKLDADADEFIGYMVDGARRMQALIQNMLAYSRLGRKGQPFAPTDCNAVLIEALANLQGAMEDSGAVVTVALLPIVLADQGQLVQLFQNLIGNAIKFHGAEKPLIQVEAEVHGLVCTFSVRDNGIGIDPQFAERIFVIFQRLHNREEYPGTGIGLAFCKKIVERHGGCIWMESHPGPGTVFRFTIPQPVEKEHAHPHERKHD